MTLIPAVASAERERLIADLANVWMNTQAAPGQVIRNAAKMLRADADLIQRAQADALDARRYRFLKEEELIITPMFYRAGTKFETLEAEIDETMAAMTVLRTSSPDPVVPRGEDGEKGK